MGKAVIDIDRNVFRSPAVSTSAVEALLLLATGPLLLLPGLVPPAASLVALLLLLALPFGLRLWQTGRLSRHSPANVPIAALLLVFLPLSLAVSPALWEVTWSRFTTLAWSIALYFAILNWPPPARKPRERQRTRLNGPTRLYLLLGLGVALAGLVGMRSVDKLFYVPLPRLFGDNGLPTNEVAGVLTLFVPFAVALLIGAWQTGRQRLFLLLTPAALLMAATLVLSQSRTGLVSVAAGVALAIALSGRVSWKWLAVGLVAAGVGLVLLASTSLADRFIFAGANSWDSVIGPRLGIWRQALEGVRDFPIWGMGLGVFGQLVALVYPLYPPGLAPTLEDAHNLYLQTALDFGVLGGLIVVATLVIALVAGLRLTRSRRPGTLARLWAAGLVASLVAHMLYSLTDAVSLGTLAGVPLWFLLGLLMQATAEAAPRRATALRPLAFYGGLALLTVGLSAVFWFTLPVNRAGQVTAEALLHPAELTAESAAVTGRLADARCPAHWFEGLQYHAAGNQPARLAAWGDLLACTNRYTGYMAIAAADDSDLARLAVAAEPDNAEGYFWLAGALVDSNPDEAVALYREGLTLRPNDGVRWQVLGDLLAPRDALAAQQAYLQSCTNGDPGANGCFRAGRIAEDRGDLTTAISYYRLSNWSGARERADALQQQLDAAGQQP